MSTILQSGLAGAGIAFTLSAASTGHLLYYKGYETMSYFCYGAAIISGVALTQLHHVNAVSALIGGVAGILGFSYSYNELYGIRHNGMNDDAALASVPIATAIGGITSAGVAAIFKYFVAKKIIYFINYICYNLCILNNNLRNYE